MKCAICNSEDVPMVGKNYASKFQIPLPDLLKTEKGARTGRGVFPRIRILYPDYLPLCKKCRRELVVRGLDGDGAKPDVDQLRKYFNDMEEYAKNNTSITKQHAESLSVFVEYYKRKFMLAKTPPVIQPSCVEMTPEYCDELLEDLKE